MGKDLLRQILPPRVNNQSLNSLANNNKPTKGTSRNVRTNEKVLNETISIHQPHLQLIQPRVNMKLDQMQYNIIDDMKKMKPNVTMYDMYQVPQQRELIL